MFANFSKWPPYGNDWYNCTKNSSGAFFIWDYKSQLLYLKREVQQNTINKGQGQYNLDYIILQELETYLKSNVDVKFFKMESTTRLTFDNLTMINVQNKTPVNTKLIKMDQYHRILRLLTPGMFVLICKNWKD